MNVYPVSKINIENCHPLTVFVIVDISVILMAKFVTNVTIRARMRPVMVRKIQIAKPVTRNCFES